MRKDFRLRLMKGSLDEGSGTFRGIAAAYDNVDQGGDRIVRGAFDRTIKAHPDGFPLLWQHKTDQPIGKVAVSDSPSGLVADGQLLMSDPQARIAFDHLRAGNIRGLSIGYEVPNSGATYDDAGVRNLSEIKLFEVSVVTFPMNEAATVSAVKALSDARRIMEEAAKSSDAEQISQLRGLLKEITQMLTPEDGECDCGAEDEEDCTCGIDEAEALADENAAKSILADLVMELKGRTAAAIRTSLRW
jgi:HK97 family phage prohead protease